MELTELGDLWRGVDLLNWHWSSRGKLVDLRKRRLARDDCMVDEVIVPVGARLELRHEREMGFRELRDGRSSVRGERGRVKRRERGVEGRSEFLGLLRGCLGDVESGDTVTILAGGLVGDGSVILDERGEVLGFDLKERGD